MFENYSNDEVTREMDPIDYDVKTVAYYRRLASSISTAREALSGQGSDWQEIRRVMQKQAFPSRDFSEIKP
jgi:hypothetical protein